MINHIEISNFRCFDSLDLRGLGRINILVGKNGSGKSAFMEALFLSSTANAPGVVLQMRAIRRIGGTLQIRQGDPWLYRSLWDDLFFEYDTRHKVAINIVDNAGKSRSLRISYSENNLQVIPYDRKLPSEVESMPQVNFVWKRGSGKQVVVKPRLTKDGLELAGSSGEMFPMAWFAPSTGENPDEAAKRFSELSKAHKSQDVIAALQREFDFVENVSIEFLSGIPMLFAEVRGRKMPVGLVSDGVSRLLSILIGIAYYQNGIILIDQLEDGFYFERLPSIWKIISQFAKSYNVQIFVSTHSGECLNAVLPSLKETPTEFKLLRAERVGKACTITQIDGSLFEGFLEQKLDVR